MKVRCNCKIICVSYLSLDKSKFWSNDINRGNFSWAKYSMWIRNYGLFLFPDEKIYNWGAFEMDQRSHIKIVCMIYSHKSFPDNTLRLHIMSKLKLVIVTRICTILQTHNSLLFISMPIYLFSRIKYNMWFLEFNYIYFTKTILMLNNGAYSRYNIIYNYQLFHWHYVLYDIEFFTQ